MKKAHYSQQCSYILHSRFQINPVTNSAPAHKAHQGVFRPKNLSQESSECFLRERILSNKLTSCEQVTNIQYMCTLHRITSIYQTIDDKKAGGMRGHKVESEEISFQNAAEDGERIFNQSRMKVPLGRCEKIK